MNKLSVALIICNLGMIPLWLKAFAPAKSTVDSQDYTPVEQVAETKVVEGKSKSKFKSSKKRAGREQRLSANFFLPILGERNSLTDMVDGMIVENLPRRMRVNQSFKKFLDEQFPDIDKELRQKKEDRFKEIMGEYLTQIYNIQRGTDTDSDAAGTQLLMKQRLEKELELSASDLGAINEHERERKSNQQMKVFQDLLIRDQDKLTEEQSSQLQNLLSDNQVTVFDESVDMNEAMERSDQTLERASEVLNPDQVEHFRNFQEFHWHSYDMPEMNDIPGMF